MKESRSASLFQSLVPVICLILFLGGNILLLDGSPHIPLILGSVVASLMGLYLGFSWKKIEKGIVEGITIALQACLILIVVGLLIGTWIISGIVPTMIYYGLQVLSPTIFLVSTCLICALVSLATGSSWSTAGTVGIALIGIGQGLGIPLPLVAGAIVSGAYVGDKMSPLSDTTNLAPAVAGAEMFSHIRHMMYTTGPSFLISLVLYTIIGFMFDSKALNMEDIDQINGALQATFDLNLWLLTAPVIVIAMVIRRIPALPALLAGAIIGGLFALIFQDVTIKEVVAAAQYGYVADTGTLSVDDLLTRGGLESMLSTVALILTALAFGGAMEKTGMLAVIAASVLKLARSVGSLVLATLFTCFSMNILAPDQYLSIVVPGRMYRDAFKRHRLAPQNLSRCLEDAGTMSSPLIPWNTCGAYMWVTLGVYPLAYLPFAFVNLLNPVMSAFFGFTGLTMKKESPQQSKTVVKGEHVNE